MEHVIFPESTDICWCLMMIRMQEKVSHFSVTDYHLGALGFNEFPVGSMARMKITLVAA
jgi:hypothetical protein